MCSVLSKAQEVDRYTSADQCKYQYININVELSQCVDSPVSLVLLCSN